ncbi:MAG: VaFE repeat-containing surface-anchored protein [Anaerovoracaceae bacterium]
MMPVNVEDSEGNTTREWYWCANPTAATPKKYDLYYELPMELAPQTQFYNGQEVAYMANTVLANAGFNTTNDDAEQNNYSKGLPNFTAAYDQFREEFTAIASGDTSGKASFDSRITRAELAAKLDTFINGGTVNGETIEKQADADNDEWKTMPDLSDTDYWEVAHVGVLGIEYAFLKYIQGWPIDGIGLIQGGSESVLASSGFIEKDNRTYGARALARLLIAYAEVARDKGYLSEVNSNSTFSLETTKIERSDGTTTVTVTTEDTANAKDFSFTLPSGVTVKSLKKDGAEIAPNKKTNSDGTTEYTFEKDQYPDTMVFQVSTDKEKDLRDKALFTLVDNKKTISKAYVDSNDIYLDEASGHYVVREFVGADDGYSGDGANEGRERSQTVFKLTPEYQSLHARIQLSAAPSIGTTVSADGTESTSSKAAETSDTTVTVKDTVSYQNLTKGQTYTVTGKLFDKTDNKEVENVTGKATFTPEAADGETTVDFGDIKLTAGHTYVVYEYLYEGKTATGDVVAKHEDKDDVTQTFAVNKSTEEKSPSIGTKVSADGTASTSSKAAETSNTSVKVVDTVAYQNLTAGTKYTLTGKLYDKTSDKTVADVAGTATFTAETADGETTVDFGTVELTAGHTYVVYEYLYKGENATGDVVASHENKDDITQTFVVKEETPTPTPETPSIGTTVSADGTESTTSKAVETSDTTVTVKDTVSYQNLTGGQTYTVTGKLYDKTDNNVVEGVTGTKTFKADADGNGETTVEFGDIKLTAGHTYVVFEYLYEGENATGDVVASHENKDDITQTFVVKEETPTPTPETPSISTTVSANGESASSDSAVETSLTSVKVVDTVTYKNLTAGTEYTLEGQLMDVTDQDNITSVGDAQTETFTPSESNGTQDIDLGTLDLEPGHTYVVYETLYEGGTAEGTAVAEHKDKNDKAQTVVVENETPVVKSDNPSISTTASANGEASTEEKAVETTDTSVKVVDKVTYENLTAGTEYTLEGQLMDVTDNDNITSVGDVKTKTFTPTGSDGSVNISFGTMDLEAGHTYVVYETLYEGDTAEGTSVAEHKDKDSTAQTIVVTSETPIVKSGYPSISTTISADGEKSTSKKAVTTDKTRVHVVDTVSYNDLTVGETYTLKGKLIDVTAGGNVVTTATKTFTAKTEDGSVKIDFGRVSLKAGHKYVAFEYLYEGKTAEGSPVAVHKDKKDKAQTLLVTGAANTRTSNGNRNTSNSGNGVKTGDNASLIWGVLLAGALAALLITIRKRRSSER